MAIIEQARRAGLIKFNAEKAEAFREAYRQAVKNNQTQFQFEGHDLLVEYAKYVVEYLDLKFYKRRTP